MALEAGIIEGPPKKGEKTAKGKSSSVTERKEEKLKQGWYRLASNPEKSFRKKSTDNADFWEPILNDPNDEFGKWVERKYKLGSGKLIQDEVAEGFSEEVIEEEME